MKKRLPLFRHRYWMLIACLMCVGLANATNINGPTYASNLVENDNIVLTGNAVLFMNRDLTLKSISGDYSLEIQGGEHTLTIKNPDGIGIQVKSFNNLASNVIISCNRTGISATGDISMQGGTLKVESRNNSGIYSSGGDVRLVGTVDVKAPVFAIYTRSYNSIYVEGNMTAENTMEDFYCIRGGNITLIGGTMNITSINQTVTSFGNMTLAGNITAKSTLKNASAFNISEGGSLLIKDGSQITALGGGNAIYAEGSITMEGGRLKAEGSSYEGIMARNGNISLKGNIDVKAAKQAIYAENGSVTVNGDLTAKTNLEDYTCIAGMTMVNLVGGTINVNSAGNAIGSKNAIILSGDINAIAYHTAIVTYGDITYEGGTLTARGEKGHGLYGNKISLTGAVDVKSDQIAIRATGPLTVNGDLTAETTLEDFYCVDGFKGITMTGGTIKITSINYGVCSWGNLTLSGDITVKATGHEASAINVREGGNLLIKDGSDITALGGGNAIYAEGSITMEGGKLKAEGSAYEGIMARKGNISLKGNIDVKAAKYAIYAENGDVVVNGNLTAKTNLEEYTCIAGMTIVNLAGGTINVNSAGNAIGSKNAIILSGDINAFAHRHAIITGGGDITFKGGTLTARGEKGMGIDSEGGTISLTGTVDVKSDEVAIRGGIVKVNGNLTAETTLEDFYCIVCNGQSTLTGGTIKVKSINYAISSGGDLTLSGNITAEATAHGSNAITVKDGGNLLIKDGSQINATCGGNAIYAEGNITMEGGKLIAYCDTVYGFFYDKFAYEGVMSRRGNISLTGDIEIISNKTSILAEDGDIYVKGKMYVNSLNTWDLYDHNYCAIQGKNVTLDGSNIEVINNFEADGVVSYGNMNLYGDIKVEVTNATRDDGEIVNTKALRTYNGGYIYFGKGSYDLESWYSNQAVYADGQIFFDLSLGILLPVNGRVYGHTIVDSNNNSADEVKIGYIPKVTKNSLFATATVNYGQQARVEGTIKAIGKSTYTMQESIDGNAWRTIQSGTIEADKARAGTTVLYKRVLTQTGYKSDTQYRMIVAHAASGERDTSAIVHINYKYPLFKNGVASDYYGAGEVFHYAKPADCRDYKYTSDLPYILKEENDYLSITMPASPLYIDEYTPTYRVEFHDSDAEATILKTEEVLAGRNATPPSMGGDSTSGRRKAPRVFRGWDKDYTNVHQDLKVFAKYDVYVDLDMDVAEHTCNRTEDWKFSSFTFTEFEGNKTMAMAGDKLTFRASVKTNTPVDVYFQSGTPLSNGEISWTTGQHVGEITGYEVNKVKTFDRQVTALVEYYNELPFEKSRFYRFYAKGNGTAETIYSAAMEIQMYYPLLITADKEVMAMTNEGYFFFSGQRGIIPVKSGEMVYISDFQGLKGAGLTYARVNKPNSLQEGYSDDGFHYILGPGETESLNVTTTKKLVIFDGVYGNGYPQRLDFSAEGFGKINGYYGEIVPCGGSVTLPPDPTEENAVFLGWTSWDPSSYDDLAYMNVPAGSDRIIGFTANFEYYDPTPQYTVRFLAKDGTLLDTQMVTEGSDATPPAAPEVDGWHFTGWDKSYETITEDVDITAIYGEDIKVWTVTYKNWDGSDLGSERVNDGEAAAGVEATRAGYTFVKWRDYTSGEDVDMEHIKANVTVEAVFTETLHTVAYRVNGIVTYTIQVVDGFAANRIYYPLETPTREATEALVYTFDYWAPEVETITEDVTFDAVFVPTARQYAVTFQNWDHTLLSEQQVAYGTSAVAPAEPEREGYVFDGWDREFDAVLADIVVTAKFRIAGVFTITWLNDDESIIDQTEVLEGETPTHADPSKPATAEFTYIFTGWSPNIESVTGDASYTATYEEIRNKYIISAEAVNGTVDGTGEYEYGYFADLTATPDEGYVFEKWSDGVTDNPRTVTVTGNATYTALFADDPDGINGIKSDNDENWYDLTGRRISKPQKGVNIIRNSNGTSRKVLQK